MKLGGRIALTVGAPVVVYAATQVPLPFVSAHPSMGGFGGMFESPQAVHVGVLALGLMPAITALLIVEVAALIVPRWRPLRIGGPDGRRALYRSVLALTLAITLLQSYFMLRYLQSARMAEGGLDGVAITLTLIGGTFALLGLARAIDRYGLGNGFAVLTAGSALLAVMDPGGIGRRLLFLLDEGPARLAGYLLAVGGMALVTWRVLTEHQRRPIDALGLRAPASGLAPLELAATVLVVPATLANFGVALGPLASVGPGARGYLALQLALVAAGCVLFVRLFNRPARVAETIARFSDAPETIDQAALRAHVTLLGRHAALKSAAFLAAVVLGTHWAERMGQGLMMEIRSTTGASLLPEAMLAVVVTAVLMDVIGEWRARTGQELLAVWPLHRLYAVDPAIARLAAAGITAYPRGVYLRTLLQFFGPWVPVELLVPKDRAAEAQTLLAAASR
jgi:preprotein translocase subunit SecY